MCTGVVKNVISRFLHRGSAVFACFLKFDLVKHSSLYEKLLARGLPGVVVQFLVNWYSDQKLMVRWGVSIINTLSSLVCPMVSGVSRFTWTPYWTPSGSLVQAIVGEVSLRVLLHNNINADDIVLLAPALRIMLKLCEDFADSHGLKFILRRPNTFSSASILT